MAGKTSDKKSFPINDSDMSLAEWRISADERKKYETYFQQCSPIQGYVSGRKQINIYCSPE